MWVSLWKLVWASGAISSVWYLMFELLIIQIVNLIKIFVLRGLDDVEHMDKLSKTCLSKWAIRTIWYFMPKLLTIQVTKLIKIFVVRGLGGSKNVAIWKFNIFNYRYDNSCAIFSA